MARRTIKRTNNRRSSRKQRGGLGGSLFTAFTSALRGSQQQTPRAQPLTPELLKSLVNDVKPVVLAYINATGSFCITTSMASKAYSFIMRKAATVPTFKTPEQIFDGFLAFLYKNRSLYVNLVTKITNVTGIQIPTNTDFKGALSLASYIPGVQQGTVLTIKTFIAENVKTAIYEAIQSVLVTESAASVCISPNKIEFAKKLIIAVARAIVTDANLKAAIDTALVN